MLGNTLNHPEDSTERGQAFTIVKHDERLRANTFKRHDYALILTFTAAGSIAEKRHIRLYY